MKKGNSKSGRSKVKGLSVSAAKASKVRGGTTVRLPDGVGAIEKKASDALQVGQPTPGPYQEPPY